MSAGQNITLGVHNQRFNQIAFIPSDDLLFQYMGESGEGRSVCIARKSGGVKNSRSLLPRYRYDAGEIRSVLLPAYARFAR
jgi:hypothetical protein